jgi:hypothetical protein
VGVGVGGTSQSNSALKSMSQGGVVGGVGGQGPLDKIDG